VRPFEPIGLKGKKALILDGFDSLVPVPEPGTMITNEQIGDWLGEIFPIPRGNGIYVYGDTGPWEEARKELLGRGVVFIAVPNVGYRVANAAEIVGLSEHNDTKAARQLTKAILHARAVNRTEADPALLRRAAEIQRDAVEHLRVLRAKARERAKNATRWNPPGDE
jgi:hypothetical protein